LTCAAPEQLVRHRTFGQGDTQVIEITGEIDRLEGRHSPGFGERFRFQVIDGEAPPDPDGDASAFLIPPRANITGGELAALRPSPGFRWTTQ
jgi:hypothetical protein